MPVNIARLLTRHEYDPVPGYNPMDELKGSPYEPYASRYTYSQSPAETAQISQEIDQENKDAATSAANGVFGSAMNILAGLIDPTIAIPGGAIYRGLKGVETLRTALSAGAAGGAAAALNEGALLATQPTRQPSESLSNIATGTLLSAPMAQEGFREPSGLVPQLRDILASEGR
jgi:hypothetical protein